MNKSLSLSLTDTNPNLIHFAETVIRNHMNINEFQLDIADYKLQITHMPPYSGYSFGILQVGVSGAVAADSGRMWC